MTGVAFSWKGQAEVGGLIKVWSESSCREAIGRFNDPHDVVVITEEWRSENRDPKFLTMTVGVSVCDPRRLSGTKHFLERARVIIARAGILAVVGHLITEQRRRGRFRVNVNAAGVTVHHANAVGEVDDHDGVVDAVDD